MAYLNMYPYRVACSPELLSPPPYKSNGPLPCGKIRIRLNSIDTHPRRCWCWCWSSGRGSPGCSARRRVCLASQNGGSLATAPSHAVRKNAGASQKGFCAPILLLLRSLLVCNYNDDMEPVVALHVCILIVCIMTLYA